MDGQTRRSIFSNEEARPDSMQHRAVKVRVQTQLSILKLIAVWKKPNKNAFKKSLFIVRFLKVLKRNIQRFILWWFFKISWSESTRKEIPERMDDIDVLKICRRHHSPEKFIYNKASSSLKENSQLFILLWFYKITWSESTRKEISVRMNVLKICGRHHSPEKLEL